MVVRVMEAPIRKAALAVSALVALILAAAAGPLLNLVKRGVRKITGDDCEVFYSGSVPHP